MGSEECCGCVVIIAQCISCCCHPCMESVNSCVGNRLQRMISHFLLSCASHLGIPIRCGQAYRMQCVSPCGVPDVTLPHSAALVLQYSEDIQMLPLRHLTHIIVVRCQKRPVLIGGGVHNLPHTGIVENCSAVDKPDQKERRDM